jgi:hypothetical protein
MDSATPIVADRRPYEPAGIAPISQSASAIAAMARPCSPIRAHDSATTDSALARHTGSGASPRSAVSSSASATASACRPRSCRAIAAMYCR